MMKALDFYSGIGGWAVGLNAAGIEVVASFEKWQPAIDTSRSNHGHEVIQCDIRKLDLNSLPKNIDIVVGSPPCTQFSFSNRGGKGDIDDGLLDVRTFLRIVKHLKPKAWIMENVPRLAGIFAREFCPGGKLEEFSDLDHEIIVIDAAEFGLPQKRKRCFVGNIDFSLFQTYKRRSVKMTLKDVILSLQQPIVNDPIYGFSISKDELTENDFEEPLSSEEIRLNHAAKKFHPIYNMMAFPDCIEKASRTVTATCTRVSRESIIVGVPEDFGFRRLTVRERATLQGFPITFQLYARNFSQKERLVGNAMPPVLSHLLGCAIKRIPSEALPSIGHNFKLETVKSNVPITPTSKSGRTYPPKRRFRFSIPSLYLKSGVRFELSNKFDDNTAIWSINFFFGPSKSIQQIRLDHELEAALPSMNSCVEINKILKRVHKFVSEIDFERLQDVWSHRGPGGSRPLDVLDELSLFGAELSQALSVMRELSFNCIERAVQVNFGGISPVNTDKLYRNSSVIAAGMYIGIVFNALSKERTCLAERDQLVYLGLR